jgi:hypothetical protein
MESQAMRRLKIGDLMAKEVDLYEKTYPDI